VIQNPYTLIVVLLVFECLVLYLASHKKFSKYFDFLPAVFWIYLLPMLASTFGMIDPKAPIYADISKYILPMALILLLMTVDIKAILNLGPMALIMFMIGSFGIMIGMVSVFFLVKGIIGPEFWSGFGALAGSWTGGSANLIAVKEALGAPDEIFLPMVVVDTLVPYIWMAILVASVGLKPAFDRWTRCDRSVLDDLQDRIRSQGIQEKPRWQISSTIRMLLIALLGMYVAVSVAQALPQIKGVISTYAWMILIVSFIGIGLSFTPARQLQAQGSNQIGYFLLYFVLTTIGAKASLAYLSQAFLLIAAGFLVVFIHAAILLAAAKFLRVPLFLVAVASQANVGGVASAPLVAEIYQKGFASVGLLLAILGNIEGTYIGILTGQICRWIGGF
jgi:uncharacterized membrane protein